VPKTKGSNHEEHEEKRANDTQGTFLNNSLIRSQNTYFGSRISDWGLKNRQNIGGKEQNPKSEFSNPKCESSNTPIPNQPLWLHAFSFFMKILTVPY
jgi:hypothetical protein